MCCRTSKYSRGDDQLFMNCDRANSRSSNRGTKKQKLKKTSSTSNSRYETSEDEMENNTSHSKQIRRSNSRNSGMDSKINSLKRRTTGGSAGVSSSGGGGGSGSGNAADGNGNNNNNNKNNNIRKKHAKSPMPEYNVSDLEQDNINDYYAVRHNSDGRYHGNESSSETSSVHNNPLRKPNFDAPAPAKGILKKSNSNPQLTKLEQEVKSSSKNNNKGVGPPGRYFLKSHTYILGAEEQNG